MVDEPPKKGFVGRHPVAAAILINILAMYVMMAWPALAMGEVPRRLYTDRLPWLALGNLLLAYFAAANKQKGLLAVHTFFFLLPAYVFFSSIQ